MRNFVDRASRDLAAQLFRGFISGKISNDEFEDQQPITHDLAIDAIWSTAWVFYSDFKEHRLEGRHNLPPDQRRGCVRWILFLHCDLLYEWPSIYLPGIDPTSRFYKNFWQGLLLGRGDLNEASAQRFLSAGHYPVWPFLRVSDYKSALSSPRFMRG